MTQKHILEKYESYLAEVVSPEAGETQLKETKRAFYAGAMGMYTLMMASSDISEAEAHAMFESIGDEIIAFAATVLRGEQ